MVDRRWRPAWADAGVICPWTIYQCYGDTRLLEEHYESMQRFVEFLSQTSRDGIRCYADYKGWHGFGDWLGTGWQRWARGRNFQGIDRTASLHTARS